VDRERFCPGWQGWYIAARPDDRLLPSLATSGHDAFDKLVGRHLNFGNSHVVIVFLHFVQHSTRAIEDHGTAHPQIVIDGNGNAIAVAMSLPPHGVIAPYQFQREGHL
jgi:hypothetical protein